MFHSEYESRLKSPSSSPTNSPSKWNSPSKLSPKKETYGDRFIPARNATNLKRTLFPAEEIPSPSFEKKQEEKTEHPNTYTYHQILHNELLSSPSSTLQPTVLKFKSLHDKLDSPFSLSPISENSQKILSAGSKTPPRKIPKTPFKILEATDIEDDFYLNLVDWSSQNILAVGLHNCVYLWNASTSQVTKLCDFDSHTITSVGWIHQGANLAIGTNIGIIQIWDITQNKKIREISGHRQRVGSLAWNDNQILASGSRDHTILLHDFRQSEDYFSKLSGHKQEVCGLKWSGDDDYLASGGNDNKVFIWTSKSSTPISRFNDHSAAVKAVAWSPHQRGLLATGGGTADRCIRFWNVNKSILMKTVDTGSQVCNLAWSKNVNELVSTHGFSQNQIVLWSYPSMNQLATLIGHTMRVLYLALSPDGQTIVTGAGDETLRFWNVFPSSKETDTIGNTYPSSFLSTNHIIR